MLSHKRICRLQRQVENLNCQILRGIHSVTRRGRKQARIARKQTRNAQVQLRSAQAPAGMRDAMLNFQNAESEEAKFLKENFSVRSACQSGNEELLKMLLASFDPDESGLTPLHVAASNNHVGCLKLLLQHDRTNINLRDAKGETALFKACLQGHTEIVSELLSFGADLKLCNYETIMNTPFIVASRGSSLACAELLYQHGANVNYAPFGYTALHYAVLDGDLDVTRWLLAHGARVDVRTHGRSTPIYFASALAHAEELKYLLQEATIELVNDTQSETGCTPLMAAAQTGNSACVELLLKNGADANTAVPNGMMAATFAIRGTLFQKQEERLSDCYKCIAMLLNSMSSETLDIFRKKECGESEHSLFHEAVDCECVEALDLLISKNLNVDILKFNNRHQTLPSEFRNLKITPLGLAATLGNVDVMLKLINAGSKVHYCNHDVVRPLMIAVMCTQLGAMKLLIEHGALKVCASCNLSPNSNLTVAFIAISANQVPVLSLLLRSGVNLNECWKHEDGLQYEDTLLGNLTEGYRKSPVGYEAVLAVLGNHLTCTNYRWLVRKLMNEFRKDVEMVRLLQEMLRIHPLQNLCRAVIHSHVSLNSVGCISKTTLKGLDVPEIISNYLLFEC